MDSQDSQSTKNQAGRSALAKEQVTTLNSIKEPEPQPLDTFESILADVKKLRAEMRKLREMREERIREARAVFMMNKK